MINSSSLKELAVQENGRGSLLPQFLPFRTEFGAKMETQQGVQNMAFRIRQSRLQFQVCHLLALGKVI